MDSNQDTKKLKEVVEEVPSVDYNALLKEEEVQEKSSKRLFIGGIVLALIIFALGFFFFTFIKNPPKEKVETPTSSSTPISTSTQTPNPLIRADWSFEVVNGSGVSGLAKRVADQIEALGYPVVKIANADRDDYSKTTILVKKELQERLDLVVADLKDIVKIASMGGELKNSTASGRIILGKDQ